MRICVFGPDESLGIMADDRVFDLGRALRADAGSYGQTLPSSLITLIEGGDDALALARAAYARFADDPAYFVEPSDAHLLAPWPGRRIACAGANYVEHLQSMFANRGHVMSAEAIAADWRAAGIQGFWKLPDVAAGDGDDIVYPARTTRLDYEGEFAIVIGKRGKDISVETAADYIWGYTLFNDLSDRDANAPLKMPLSLNLGKNFDGSTSIGPCILVDDDIDPQNLSLTLSVNGAERQSFSTRSMMFSFAEFIAHLSRDFTLVPGDVIAGGTGKGTAMDSSRFDESGKSLPDLFLRPGDEISIHSPMIGTLRNRIVLKSM